MKALGSGFIEPVKFYLIQYQGYIETMFRRRGTSMVAPRLKYELFKFPS